MNDGPIICLVLAVIAGAVALTVGAIADASARHEQYFKAWCSSYSTQTWHHDEWKKRCH